MTGARSPTQGAVVTVVDAGPMTIFVDRGRSGWAHLAVPESGAYDRASFERANRLVGNRAGAPGLEVLLGPITLHFGRAATVALAGVIAEIDMSVWAHPDGGGGRALQTRTHTSESTLTAPAGTTLRIGTFRWGVRGYLSIRGGWSEPPILGSVSADTLSGLGPQPLRSGQQLLRGSAIAAPPQDRGRALTPLDHHTIAIDRSPLWSREAFEWLLATHWTVSPDSDRIGMRMLPSKPGPAIPVPPRSTDSVPVVRGAVQVPPSGMPVIMGPDHPTTGGYPVAAVVTRAGSDALAQARPGEAVRFAPAHRL